MKKLPAFEKLQESPDDVLLQLKKLQFLEGIHRTAILTTCGWGECGIDEWYIEDGTAENASYSDHHSYELAVEHRVHHLVDSRILELFPVDRDTKKQPAVPLDDRLQNLRAQVHGEMLVRLGLAENVDNYIVIDPACTAAMSIVQTNITRIDHPLSGARYVLDQAAQFIFQQCSIDAQSELDRSDALHTHDRFMMELEDTNGELHKGPFKFFVKYNKAAWWQTVRESISAIR